MQIQYENNQVEKLLIDCNHLNKKIGSDFTRAYVKRRSQLLASNNLKVFMDLGIGNPHSLHGNLEGYIGISISRNYRLVIKPIDINEDFENCETIIVKGVCDYHGSKINWIIP